MLLLCLSLCHGSVVLEWTWLTCPILKLIHFSRSTSCLQIRVSNFLVKIRRRRKISLINSLVRRSIVLRLRIWFVVERILHLFVVLRELDLKAIINLRFRRLVLLIRWLLSGLMFKPVYLVFRIWNSGCIGNVRMVSQILLTCTCDQIFTYFSATVGVFLRTQACLRHVRKTRVHIWAAHLLQLISWHRLLDVVCEHISVAQHRRLLLLHRSAAFSFGSRSINIFMSASFAHFRWIERAVWCWLVVCKFSSLTL